MLSSEVKWCLQHGPQMSISHCQLRSNVSASPHMQTSAACSWLRRMLSNQNHQEATNSWVFCGFFFFSFFLHHAKCYKADGRDREDVVQCEMLSYYIWRRGKFDFGKFSLHSVSNLHDAACPAADLFIFSSLIFYDPDRLTTCDSWDGLKLPPLLQSWVGLVVKKKAV